MSAKIFQIADERRVRQLPPIAATALIPRYSIGKRVYVTIAASLGAVLDVGVIYFKSGPELRYVVMLDNGMRRVCREDDLALEPGY